MLHIALYQPEIPPNTGNIIRLCANTGCTLHLIHPLGFTLQNKHLRRAGLDYHDLAAVQEHKDYAGFLQQLKGRRLVACSTKSQRWHSHFSFKIDDVLLFGSETSGLPNDILVSLAPGNLLRIPMQDNSRSLNLSNAVAITVYEAWRQLHYCGVSALLAQ